MKEKIEKIRDKILTARDKKESEEAVKLLEETFNLSDKERTEKEKQAMKTLGLKKGKHIKDVPVSKDLE